MSKISLTLCAVVALSLAACNKTSNRPAETKPAAPAAAPAKKADESQVEQKATKKEMAKKKTEKKKSDGLENFHPVLGKATEDKSAAKSEAVSGLAQEVAKAKGTVQQQDLAIFWESSNLSILPFEAYVAFKGIIVDLCHYTVEAEKEVEQCTKIGRLSSAAKEGAKDFGKPETTMIKNFGSVILPELRKLDKGLNNLYVRLTMIRNIHMGFADQQIISQEYVDLDEVATLGVVSMNMLADVQGIKNQKVGLVSIAITPSQK
jgi:hypothetical protein